MRCGAKFSIQLADLKSLYIMFGGRWFVGVPAAGTDVFCREEFDVLFRNCVEIFFFEVELFSYFCFFVSGSWLLLKSTPSTIKADLNHFF